MSVPFGERGGQLRGALDLVAGRYPRFVFGGSIGRLLPVFHFHDETRDSFEPQLRHLAENGYRTITADDIARYISGGTLPERAVALCFDDAWTSVWTMAAPLLLQHGFQAILYAIPGRTDDAHDCRPRTAAGASGSPLATWPELRAMAAEGSFDVQSHTYSHAMISTSSTPIDFVAPGYDSSSLLGRPLVDEAGEVEATPVRARRPRFATPADLGAPLYPARSRMSEAPRVRRSPAVRDACVNLVAREGGAAFFARQDWRSRLLAAATTGDAGRAETDAEQQRAIDDELDAARAELNARLGTDRVRHVCLPWGVSGRQTADALRRLGIVTAVANRMPGMFAVRPGDDPHWLKRLPNRYIYRLPGTGRRWWFSSAR
jgi:peptidoglycan/xylan/chitin deacetylase (PgdA/CDA1 family)